MLTLHTANRYEDLRDRLLSEFDAADGPLSANPFAVRQIVIPSMAIRRDLQLALARHRGVCLRVEFPFLAQWLWECFARWIEVPEQSPFAPERLTWRLYRIFNDAEFVLAHPRLVHFLDQADPVMRLELASRTAGLFEQWVTFRPDWLADWQEGKKARRLSESTPREDEIWLAALWRRLIQELGIGHHGHQHPAEAFLSALQNGSVPRSALPPSIDLFALPTLPPQTLQMLDALSNTLDIRLYLLNPCAEYWFDLVDRKRLARLQAENRADFHETGHPLLSSWGKQTQALFTLLFERENTVEASADFVEHPDTLLGQIQNAILRLETRPEITGQPADRSLEIHVCHSLTRELEALHDRLLGLMNDDPTLQADQILVALPDLETAAPFIHAVFGARQRLPYTITGLSEARQNPVARTLLLVMETLLSRLTASEGFALLRDPRIARRFHLDESAIEALAEALTTAGLHWGLSGPHGWREALARLLLGQALGSNANYPPFQGILPAQSGINSEQLGQLGQFLDKVAHFQDRLSLPLTAQAWLSLWNDLLDHLLLIDQEDYEAGQQVREMLAALTRAMQAGDPPAKPERYPAAIARAALTQTLSSSPRGGIPGGTLTFAAMSSLRHLPYPVICLLGLNDGEFPGNSRPLEFDLMAQDYRPGDRQRRLDERNLFLDLFLSARRYLHLSYTGRSQRDDSPLPPSTVIAELLDELAPALGKDGLARLHVHHPLQAFSERYNHPDHDSRLVHYPESAPEDTPAALLASLPAGLAQAPDASVNDNTVFFPSPLPPPQDPHWQHPALSDLQTFFRHPAKILLRDRLGIRLPATESPLTDEEPLWMTPGDSRPLGQRLLAHCLNATLNPAQATPLDPVALAALATAGTEVPVGAIGQAQLQPLLARLQPFAAKVQQHQQADCLSPQQTTVVSQSCPVTLYLHLHDIRPNGLVRYRFAALSAGDLISAWLDHLALCTLSPHGVTLRTVHLACPTDGEIREYTFRPVDHPIPLWQAWLSAYWTGLQEPLIFPPRTAVARQQECLDDPQAGVSQRTQAQWYHAQQDSGEFTDPWWQLALRGHLTPHLFDSPLAGRFDHWREALLAPLFAHLDSGSGQEAA